jgi:hypothetical protein
LIRIACSGKLTLRVNLFPMEATPMRVPIGTFALAATCAVIAIPDAGAQQQLSWNNYCTLGANALCSSIQLDLTPDGGGTDFEIRLQNLEGMFGNTPWALYNVTFDLATNLMGGAATPTQQATLSGNSGFLVTATSGECATHPELGDCTDTGWGGVEWDSFGAQSGSTIGRVASTSDNLPRPFGIIGCDAPSQPAIDNQYWGGGYFRTCGDGWVNFDFTLPGQWMFTDESQVSITTFDGQNFGSCVFDQTCVQNLTATPEPTTVTLLATGLFAVAIVGERRRRRKSSTTV